MTGKPWLDKTSADVCLSFRLTQILYEPSKASCPIVRRRFLKSLMLYILARVARTPQFLALIRPLLPNFSGQFHTLNPFSSMSMARRYTVEYYTARGKRVWELSVSAAT